MRPLLRSSVFGILAAALLAACGKGTPLTSGTATPAPPYVPNVSSEYTVPTASSRPMGLVAIASTTSISFTENASSKIGTLTQQGVISTPEPLTPTKNAGPDAIASGPNGLLWFSETNIGKVGQINPAAVSPVISEFLLSNTARPTSITLGSDGNMWVTDPATNAIWKISQKGIVGGPCLLPSNADPTSIVTGSDGSLWFTEAGINKIGRLPITNTSSCGTVTQFNIPTRNAGLNTIVAGADGALWFTERNAKKLGRMQVTGHVAAEYKLSPALTPSALVEGVDNNFYFADPGSNQIGQFITTTQKVKLFKIKTANAQPGAMILGVDQQIYFAEMNANKLGQFKYFCC